MMMGAYEADIENMITAIHAGRASGVPLHDAELPFYRAAAVAALKALGVIPTHEVDGLTVALHDIPLLRIC
jgi:hypothetical protein